MPPNAPPPPPPVPAPEPTPQTNPQPLGSQPSPQAGQPATPAAGSFTTSVFDLKTLLIIAVVAALYAASNLVVGLAFVIWLAGVIVTWKMVSGIKQKPADAAQAADKPKITVLMAIDPVSAQAIFYYRLRKTKPNMAKAFNSFGWKVFGLEILLSIVGSIGLSVLKHK